MFKPLTLHLLWICWLVLICILSLTPGDQLPKIEWEVFSIATLAHFCFYSGLAFLQLTAVFASQKKKVHFFLNLSDTVLYGIVILVGLLCGYLIELIQEKLIHMRYYDFEDLIANGIGTIIGVSLAAWIGKKLV